MSGRNIFAVAKVLLALLVLLLGAGSALAYAGPGADLTFVSSAMTLLVWALVACSSVVLWPLYALLRKIRGGKTESTKSPAPEKTPEEGRVASHTDS